MFNFKHISNITFFKVRHYIFISVFGIITLFLSGCDDTPNFEGDKIIGTWVLTTRINTIDDTVEEFDISEMVDKTIFYNNGKYKSTREGNASSGKWRNLGDGIYRFSNDGGLLNWSHTTMVEFVGDSEMNYTPPLAIFVLEYYIKIE